MTTCQTCKEESSQTAHEPQEVFVGVNILPHGCSAKTDGVFVDVNMVATWMLCKNGRSLSERYQLSGMPHGCSAKTGGVFVDTNMVAAWMLCGN